MARHKLRNTRPKALFGTEAAATLAAAGIQAAATTAASIMGANTQQQAAQQQATAMIDNADRQAKALEAQNQNNNKLQEKMIEVTKSENEKMRDIMNTTQMNTQMMAGMNNMNDRYNMSRIQVKHGGSVRRKLKNEIPLQGSFNLPFTVTDGGGVVRLGQTANGNDIYEIFGNDHDHYHKTRGKSKTGVGIKFANGSVIEGEGNQNTNLGELLMVSPFDAKFISKHNIAGFNPAKAVLAGMNPEYAFAKQEQLKAENNIDDDYKAKYGKRLSLKKGGRCKAALGFGTPKIFISPLDFNSGIWTRGLSDIFDKDIVNKIKPVDTEWKTNNMQYLDNLVVTPTVKGYTYQHPKVNIEPHKLSTLGLSNPNSSTEITPAVEAAPVRGSKFNIGDFGYSMFGAGIGALGNLLGAGITNNAIKKSMNYTIDANNQAADALKQAYGNLKTIDTNIINKKDFQAADALAITRSPRINANPQLSDIERSLQRVRTATNENAGSQAAKENRLNRAETDAYDRRSRVYGDVNQMVENISQKNQEILNQTANLNADRQTKAIQDYMNSKLNLLQYNNDIENQKIMGIGETEANRLGQNASTYSSGTNTIGQGWGSAIVNSGAGFADAFNNYLNNRFSLKTAMLGATPSALLNWAAMNNDKPLLYSIYNKYKGSNSDYELGLRNRAGMYLRNK